MEVLTKELCTSSDEEKMLKLKETILELKFALKDTAFRATPGAIAHYKDKFGFTKEIAQILLVHSEPKIRSNTAYCTGKLLGNPAVDIIVEAYRNEPLYFNKESYLEALDGLDVKEYVEFFKNDLKELGKRAFEVEKNNEKNCLKSQMRMLLSILRKYLGKKVFCDPDTENEVMLITNRNFPGITLDKIKGKDKKVFNAGVSVKCTKVGPFAEIRTYEEMLFAPPLKDPDGIEISDGTDSFKCFVKEILMPYINERVKGKGAAGNLPVAFRLDIKGIKERAKESEMLKNCCDVIEDASDFCFINLRNDYDVEVRLILRSSGKYRPLVKFTNPRDKRFSYRTGDLPTALRPVTAALICNLASEYLISDAKVLDPFCGTGTLLIERDRFKPAGDLFGADIYGPAATLAKNNLDAAGLKNKSMVINRDFLSLKHDILFDELITDMPFDRQNGAQDKIRPLYSALFEKAKTLLKPGATLIIYTHDSKLLKSAAKRAQVPILKEFEISMVEGTYLYILKI